MASTKLTAERRLFILRQVAAFETSPSVIQRRLADPEYLRPHGLKPIAISHQRVSIAMNKLDKQDITDERVRYLADFSDTPLFYSVNRVRELERMYKTLHDDTDEKPKQAIRLKMKILEQIRAETGEDIDMIAKAIEKSGSVTNQVYYDFSKVTDDERDAQRRSIASMF